MGRWFCIVFWWNSELLSIRNCFDFLDAPMAQVDRASVS